MRITSLLSGHKFVLWGIGEFGKAFFHSIENESIVAIIENNPSLVGKMYENIPIISFDTYLQTYKAFYVIVTPMYYGEIVALLERFHVYRYFVLEHCPTECQGYAQIGTSTDFPNPKRWVCEKIGIFGVTLYSIAVFYYYKKNGIANVFFVNDPEFFDDKMWRTLKDFDLEKYLMALAEFSKRDAIVETFPRDVVLSPLKDVTEATVYDIFDSTQYSNEKANPDILKFKDMHKGQRCFIVATGPSLTMVDLTTLHTHNEMTMSMNNIMPAFEHTAWRPNYYVAMDKTFITEHEVDIEQAPIEAKFIGDLKDEYWCNMHNSSIYRFHVACRYLETYVRFSLDFASKIYDGMTVTYACLQLAVYMGFQDIYLLGVDFNYPKDVEVQDLHFSKDYYKESSMIFKKGVRTNMDAMYHAYKKAKEVCDILGVKIYNATRGGKLEVFERVDFDTLFDNNPNE